MSEVASIRSLIKATNVSATAKSNQFYDYLKMQSVDMDEPSGDASGSGRAMTVMTRTVQPQNAGNKLRMTLTVPQTPPGSRPPLLQRESVSDTSESVSSPTYGFVSPFLSAAVRLRSSKESGRSDASSTRRSGSAAVNSSSSSIGGSSDAHYQYLTHDDVATTSGSDGGGRLPPLSSRSSGAGDDDDGGGDEGYNGAAGAGAGAGASGAGVDGHGGTNSGAADAAGVWQRQPLDDSVINAVLQLSHDVPFDPSPAATTTAAQAASVLPAIALSPVAEPTRTPATTTGSMATSGTPRLPFVPVSGRRLGSESMPVPPPPAVLTRFSDGGSDGGGHFPAFSPIRGSFGLTLVPPTAGRGSSSHSRLCMPRVAVVAAVVGCSRMSRSRRQQRAFTMARTGSTKVAMSVAARYTITAARYTITAVSSTIMGKCTSQPGLRWRLWRCPRRRRRRRQAVVPVAVRGCLRMMCRRCLPRRR